MAVGVILPLVRREPPQSIGALTNSLATEAPATSEDWSPAIFRLGFSFFVGFVVAYALRWFLKTALLAAGFMALLLFGLQYGGLIEVKWGAIEDKYEEGSGWVSRQTESFQALVTGALPSAGAAGFGRRANSRRGLGCSPGCVGGCRPLSGERSS